MLRRTHLASTRLALMLGGLLVVLALVGAGVGALATSAAANARKEAVILGYQDTACHLVDDGTFNGTWVYCWDVSAAGVPTTVHAKLDLNGQFSTLTTTALPSGLGGPLPPVPYHVDLGPFRCEGLSSGIECTVLATGKGFLINEHEVIAVSLPASPVPIFGLSAELKTVSGIVLVKTPGAVGYVPLSTLTSVPLGTTVDTTNGTVQLTAALDNRGDTETGQFYSGIFRVTQTHARSKLRGGRRVAITVLTLVGGLPAGCSSSAGKAAASARAVRLWGNAHGNFRTTGRSAAATVRGTKWLTEETCAGTLVKVARGVVSVENLRTHRTVLVRAGSGVLTRVGAAAASAPCTEPALAAGLRRGKLSGSIDGKSWGCAGRFAFAGVIVKAGAVGDEITVLFRAEAQGWEVASRAKYCEDGAVPARIRQPACESN
jgi:hypothetical protein